MVQSSRLKEFRQYLPHGERRKGRLPRTGDGRAKLQESGYRVVRPFGLSGVPPSSPEFPVFTSKAGVGS